MLTSIMHSISKQGDRYGMHRWMFRISGNRVDICARSTNEKDPEQFRQAVISIGQVLQAVDFMATLSGHKTLIQSLPSLDEKHLIAILRLKKKDEAFSPEEKIAIDTDQGIVPLLDTLACHYGMLLKQIPRAGDKNPDLKNIRSELFAKISGKQCIVLCSKTDNPFVWLKTGYWMERVLQLKAENSSIPDIEMCPLLYQKVRSGLDNHFGDSCCSQVLILCRTY